MITNNTIKIILSFFVFTGVISSATAQLNGALFMLRDNFYAQIQNPSFMRDDESIIVALPGFSGFSLRNEANFKLTDFVVTRSDGDLVWDLEHFYHNGERNKKISQWLNIPVLYVDFPALNGRINLSYREQIQNMTLFPSEALAFFENGNVSETYRNYYTGNMDFSLLATHQFGFGYSTRLSENTTIGIRGNVIFGAIYLQADNWNFGVQTSESGDEVLITSAGTGKIATKFPTVTINGNQLTKIRFDNYLENYVFNYTNPGIGLDAGFTTKLQHNSSLTVSLNDFGFILFKKNAIDIHLSGSYAFRGMDITDVIGSRDEAEYRKPLDLMLGTKDSIRSVYRPFFSNSSFYKGTSPKVFIQYRKEYLGKFSAAIGNQTIFQKGQWLNTSSLSVLKNYKQLSFVGNMSLFNFRAIAVGGGVQWTNHYSQLFLVTDNLLALVHPASQRNFSVTVGINLLLNQNEKEYKKDDNRGGKILPHLPFYRKYK